MAIESLTFDSERSESIRNALAELAEKAERLADNETVRANELEKERDEAIEERDQARKESTTEAPAVAVEVEDIPW